jgi:putative PIN family toxin of toxin-antitoxin system
VRVILDTDVIVAAMRSPSGASAELLRMARAGQFQLLASVPLMIEYEASCSRREHLVAAQLDRDNLEIFLNALAAIVKPVAIHYLWRPALRDAGDEMVLEAAINGEANFLVTFNLADFGVVPGQFGLELLKPSDALRRLR